MLAQPWTKYFIQCYWVLMTINSFSFTSTLHLKPYYSRISLLQNRILKHSTVIRQNCSINEVCLCMDTETQHLNSANSWFVGRIWAQKSLRNSISAYTASLHKSQWCHFHLAFLCFAGAFSSTVVMLPTTFFLPRATDLCFVVAF